MKLNQNSEMLPRANLVELVMDRVKAWISDGDLKPGDKLPSEKELSEHFRVARSVVREAISRLNALEIVETYHGRGSYVAELQPGQAPLSDRPQPDDDYLSHLWELRLLLEPEVARLAASRRDDQDLSNLEAAIQAMGAAIARGEPGLVEDDTFHQSLVKAVHNPLLEQLTSNITRMAEPYKRLSIDQPFRPVETQNELIEIFQAVAGKNPERAHHAMHLHIKRSMHAIE
ncbi:MAG TPA: FadR/GntR family transcriptional regulator [Anaerolineaceae bacterium]|nr:FadR/GntR family transcriptional regulator [Anaerolineaceae bacterium]